MGFFGFLYPWGILFQLVALIHFIRRRPDTYWLWVIIFFGPIGALVYIFAEMVPDVGLLSIQFKMLERRKRINDLEALVQVNPAAGNYEELGGLYFENGDFTRARDAYNHAISSRTDSPDPFYRRAICEVELKDFAAARPDLERVFAKDPKYDFLRAQGLLAHVLANTGSPDQAAILFESVTQISTLSETMFNFACFLQQQGRLNDARSWAQRILEKKAAMPGYLKRRERPWFRKASSLLKQLPRAD